MGVERIGARQTDMASAFRSYHAPEQCPARPSGAADARSYSPAPATPPCNFNTEESSPCVLAVPTSTPPTATPYTQLPYHLSVRGHLACRFARRHARPKCLLTHSVKHPRQINAAL